MQIRDWLLIGIPVLCNGFIIFFVQKHYTQRLEHKLRQNLRLIDTIDGFKQIIQKCTIILNKFYYRLSNEEANKSLSELLELIVKDFDTYVTNNRLALSSSEKTIKNIIELAEKLIEATKSSDSKSIDTALNKIKLAFSQLSDELELQMQKL